MLKPCPWWHFWNPMSGIRGGLIGGLLVLALITYLLHRWHP